MVGVSHVLLNIFLLPQFISEPQGNPQPSTTHLHLQAIPHLRIKALFIYYLCTEQDLSKASVYSSYSIPRHLITLHYPLRLLPMILWRNNSPNFNILVEESWILFWFTFSFSVHSHTLGWCLQRSTYTGSILYPKLETTKCSLLISSMYSVFSPKVHVKCLGLDHFL